MRRETISLLLVMTLILLSCNQLINIANSTEQQSLNDEKIPTGDIIHGQIAIDGDADFSSQAASESWSGSGELGNPYRIENYYIDVTSGIGIEIENTQVYFVIQNCTIFGSAPNYGAIRLDNVDNGTIIDNEIHDVQTGIYLVYSDSNIIENNEISSCTNGIYMGSSDSVTVHNNTCSNNSDYDILVTNFSKETTITNNTCASTGLRNIDLTDAANATISHNRMYGKGFEIDGRNNYELVFVEFIDNSVNGTPVLFLQDQVGGEYSGNYAQIILIRCENVHLRDMLFNGTQFGISILHCNDTIVKNVTSIRCYYGIEIVSGHRVTVSDCNASYNRYMGLLLDWGQPETDTNDHLITNSTFSYNGYRAMLIGGAGGTTIFNNTCHNNHESGQSNDQIFVMNTKDITITNNTCWATNAGSANIYCAADNSVIANNTCINSNGHGIELDGADGAVVIDNYCSDVSYGILVGGTDFAYVADNFCNGNSVGISIGGTSSNNIISSNNCSDGGWAGIAFSGKSNNLVWMNECKNNTGAGITLSYLNQINTIANNTCSNNTDEGIYFDHSEWAIITNNTCNYNSIGISLNDQSYNNSIYWNLFLDNTQNGLDNGDDNHITNNYWSDYAGVDTTPVDGIGDTPYPIAGGASNEDPYPWMNVNFIPILSSWVTIPTTQYVEYPNGFSLDLDTTAPEPLVMWINDTIHFSIDSNWVITNITSLDIGVYGLRVTGRNMYGHHLVAEFNIIVQDTTAPVWVSVPDDIEKADMTELWSFDLAATDISGVTHYWISDYDNFTIDDGYIINQWELLSRGNYSLEVRAYDPYDNYVSKEFILSLVDMDPPIINHPDDINTNTAEGFIISWYPTDATPWKYEIFRDGALYETDTWVQYDEITVNTLEDTVGSYNYTVIVYDLDGNTVTDTVIVTVTPGPPTSTTEPTDTEPTLPPPIDMTLILVYGTVAVVVIVIVIIALKKRR